MKKLFLLLLLSLGLTSISYAANTIITNHKKMTDSQLRGWYSMISYNTKLQKNFGNIKPATQPTYSDAFLGLTPDQLLTLTPAPPPAPVEEAPPPAPPPAPVEEAPPPAPPSAPAEEVVAEAPAEEVVDETPAEEALDSAPTPVVAGATPVPKDTPVVAPDDPASEPAPAPTPSPSPNPPPMVELDVWIMDNPATKPVSPSTDLETLTPDIPDTPDAPDAPDVIPSPAPATDDPCKPTKTVSADGTYFVYTCNGQASSSSVTNSASVTAAEPALDKPFREGWTMVEGSNFWSVDESSPYWETEEGSKKAKEAKDRGSWIKQQASAFARENPGVDAPNSGYWATDGCGEGKQPPGASCN